MINHIDIIYVSGWLGAGKNSSTFKWLENWVSNSKYNDVELYAIETKGEDVKGAIDSLGSTISKCKLGKTLIVANSFGAFISSFFSIPTIWINPCLYPCESLVKVTEISDEFMKVLETLTQNRDHAHLLEDRLSYFSVCSDNDEIIGTDHKVITLTNHKPVVVPGGKHKLTDEQRDKYLSPLLSELLKRISEK